MFDCVHRGLKFSLMTPNGKMLYFASVTTVRELLEVLLMWETDSAGRRKAEIFLVVLT
jgi:hypothetical protein